jgi:hypothetical protein
MQAEQPHIELAGAAAEANIETWTSGIYTRFEAYRDFGHPYWLQAPLPAYEFLRNVSELSVRESNASAERGRR